MSDIVDKMKLDMFAAVKSKDSDISGIIQMVLSAIKNNELEKGEALSEQDLTDTIRKESKKLQDTMDQLSDSGRADLLVQSKKQKDYLDQYLPQMMSEDEIAVVVDGLITELGATGMNDMGRVMGQVMQKLNGKADGVTVKNVVTSKLNG